MRRILVLLLLPAIVACGSSGPPKASETALDLRELELKLAEDAQDEQPDVLVTGATCPKDPPVPDGAVLNCSIDVSGFALPVKVTVRHAGEKTSDYETQRKPFLVTEKVEQELLQPLDVDAEADCGNDPILPYEVGSRFPCTVRGDSDAPEREVFVEVADAQGKLKLELSQERVRLPGGSVTFVRPAGFEDVTSRRSGESPDLVAELSLRLSEGNEIGIEEYRARRRQREPKADADKQSLALASAKQLRSIGYTVIGKARPVAVGGVQGVSLLVKSSRPKPRFRKTRLNYIFAVRGRSTYTYICQYTPPDAKRLVRSCEETFDSVRIGR